MVLNIRQIKKPVLMLGMVLVLAAVAGLTLIGRQYSQSRENAQPEPVARSAAAINGSNRQNSDFFASYRIERDQVRGREISLLKEITTKTGSSQETKNTASRRLIEISGEMENELKAENLVKCRGVQDCVAIMQPDMATVIIASNTMEPEEKRDIKSVLAQALQLEETEISLILHSPLH